MLQWPHYQAVIDLTFDAICHRLVLLFVLSNMDQELSESITPDREGMNKQGAGHEAFALQQLQQDFPTIQTPARPQEVFHLVKEKKSGIHNRIIIHNKISQTGLFNHFSQIKLHTKSAP